MTEVWKPFKGFEGIAEVSSLGNVRTLDTIRHGLRNGKPHAQRRKGRPVSPYKSRFGYMTIAFKIGSKRQKAFVHRAVGHAFVDGYFDGATINHKNGDKTDNRPENLEWCSLSDNTKHQWETGLVNIRGERHPSSKLTDAQTAAILHLSRAERSAKELAALYDVSEALIYKIRQGRKPVSADHLSAFPSSLS